jgi:hypothetical protein
MKFRYSVIFSFIISCVSIYCQDKPTDFSMFLKENIEFAALKPFFYLIRQEYILLDEDGKSRVRAGNDFYGKAYTIGVLTEDTKLWFPTYIRSPWKIDNTYDKQIDISYKPECSIFGMKNYADQSYFRTKIQNISEDDLITFISAGRQGIALEESPQDNGTLIVFYSSAASPDDFEVITHSIMFLEEINWNPDGIAEIEELNYSDNVIIGGALFSRYLNPGVIRWKLSGLYLPVDNKWILKSVCK